MQAYLPSLYSHRKWVLHLLFFRIPKNASTSIYKHLGDWNLIHKHKESFDREADPKLYKYAFEPTHAKPDEALKVLGHGMQQYFSFTVCRNPWDRAVSMYYFAKSHKLNRLYGEKDDLTFEDFCGILSERRDDAYFIAAHKQVDWLQGKFPPQTILRFETLKADFQQMLLDYDIKHISPDIPHLNATSQRDAYQSMYSTETKTIISDVFGADIDYFKYSY